MHNLAFHEIFQLKFLSASFAFGACNNCFSWVFNLLWHVSIRGWSYWEMAGVERMTIYRYDVSRRNDRAWLAVTGWYGDHMPSSKLPFWPSGHRPSVLLRKSTFWDGVSDHEIRFGVADFPFHWSSR
jgi:hypothetical protein